MTEDTPVRKLDREAMVGSLLDCTPADGRKSLHNISTVQYRCYAPAQWHTAANVLTWKADVLRRTAVLWFLCWTCKAYTAGVQATVVQISHITALHQRRLVATEADFH